jgi:hypothetical protein
MHFRRADFTSGWPGNQRWVQLPSLTWWKDWTWVGRVQTGSSSPTLGPGPEILSGSKV